MVGPGPARWVGRSGGGAPEGEQEPRQSTARDGVCGTCFRWRRVPDHAGVVPCSQAVAEPMTGEGDQKGSESEWIPAHVRAEWLEGGAGVGRRGGAGRRKGRRRGGGAKGQSKSGDGGDGGMTQGDRLREGGGMARRDPEGPRSMQDVFGTCQCDGEMSGEGSAGVARAQARAVGAGVPSGGRGGRDSGRDSGESAWTAEVLEVKSPCPFQQDRRGRYLLGRPRPHDRVPPHAVPQLQMGEWWCCIRCARGEW